MAKAKSKKTVHKAAPRHHALHKEVPTLNALVVVFYILIFILFVGIYFSKIGQ